MIKRKTVSNPKVLPKITWNQVESGFEVMVTLINTDKEFSYALFLPDKGATHLPDEIRESIRVLAKDFLEQGGKKEDMSLYFNHVASKTREIATVIRESISRW